MTQPPFLFVGGGKGRGIWCGGGKYHAVFLFVELGWV